MGENRENTRKLETIYLQLKYFKEPYVLEIQGSFTIKKSFLLQFPSMQDILF